MPELVAVLHSFVGAAAVLVGIASYLDTSMVFTGSELLIHEVEVFIGVFIGAVTFTGSVVAFGKLRGVLGDFEGERLRPEQPAPVVVLLEPLFERCAVIVPQSAFAARSDTPSLYVKRGQSATPVAAKPRLLGGDDQIIRIQMVLTVVARFIKRCGASKTIPYA